MKGSSTFSKVLERELHHQTQFWDMLSTIILEGSYHSKGDTVSSSACITLSSILLDIVWLLSVVYFHLTYMYKHDLALNNLQYVDIA